MAIETIFIVYVCVCVYVRVCGECVCMHKHVCVYGGVFKI